MAARSVGLPIVALALGTVCLLTAAPALAVITHLDGPPADIPDAAALEDIYLNQDAGRQILHVTFGSVLSDATLGPVLRELLMAEPATHREVLVEHFGKHLKALRRGMK